MNKLDKFMNWVCGKTDEFPFFKEEEMPKIPKVEIPDSENEKDELRQRYGI